MLSREATELGDRKSKRSGTHRYKYRGDGTQGSEYQRQWDGYISADAKKHG
jgi:hypothetical protein